MKHRGIVMGRKGMVASAHTLISSSGLKVLQSGGNAVDSAIAMALTSGLVLPDMCGLGGDAFALYYDAKTKKVTAINGSGGAPKAATLEKYRELGHTKMPNDGMLSVTVPGAVDVYFAMLEKWGTKSFTELAQDAIELAREGVPASEKVVRHMHTDYNKLMRYENMCNLYLNDGKPMMPGDIIKNPDYAKSLEYLCENGKDGFYKGEIADAIVAHSKKHGGLFEKEDFVDYQCEFLEPISVDYRGMKVFQTPPVSQGIIHLEELNILNQIDMSQYQPDSAEAIHTMVEAKKIAFFDRKTYFGDPDYVKNPTCEILTEEYAKKMAAKIKMDSCLNEKDVLGNDLSHTTSMVVVDKEGNAVSFIHSVAGTWGSCEVVEGTGILLNNRASQFHFNSSHPNALKPTKRTIHTLNTYLITDQEGNLKYVGNTPGGDNQPQWNMQTVVNLLDFGMDVQTAVEHGKWTDNATINEDGSVDHVLKIESQVGEEVLNKLREMGHQLQVIEPFTCSGASQIIEVKENGLLFGGSDPRADGAAMPEI